MFIITWLFDKLGYMPKIDMEIGKVNLKLQETWPFPVIQDAPVKGNFTKEEIKKAIKTTKKKVIVPKATTRKSKPAVAAKTARAKKK